MEHQIGDRRRTGDGCRDRRRQRPRGWRDQRRRRVLRGTRPLPAHGRVDVSGHGERHFVPAEPHELVYGKHDRVIRCPWHGWEFDLETGRSLLEPERFGLKVYPVTVEDGVVVLHT